jgi:alcohol dehydrogenase
MQGSFAWHMPVQVDFGVGCAQRLGEVLGARRALVLAFEPARALGLVARWHESLGDRLVDWVDVADGLSSIARAGELAARVWPRLAAVPGCVLVAVGGGTTMDLAKVLRCRPSDSRFDSLVVALRGGTWPELEPTPLWLLPTTAGTGSEVTRWATVWDTDATPAHKLSLDEPWGYAERAFVDPTLSVSCPAEVTRDTALDTLSHALEALWNRHANPVSDRLAVSAARRVIATLPACLERPRDLALRTQLALAAVEAGLAFSQTRTALAHALSYAVTLEHGVPHGLACAIWLPVAWQLALGRDAGIDARLAQVFEEDVSHGPARLLAWLRGLGVDACPAAFGVHDADARINAALASPRGRNFIAAP